MTHNICMAEGFVIAIDGPVASGKGTIAAKLAHNLKGFYLYTGAMYRCIALLCLNKGKKLERPLDVESVLPDLDIEFKDNKILLSGKDVTKRIQEPDVASGASVIGVLAKARGTVDQKLREIAKKAVSEGLIVVSEGRDTATTIFPDSPLKIYLTASPEVRAKRRLYQYSALAEKDLKQALNQLKLRDERDTNRKESPLPANPKDLGYFVIDNSNMSEVETLTAIKNEIKNRKLI